MPATVVGYSEWPKNTPNYWALPAMGDAVGWTYRKDWFARPELQTEFKEKYGRDLAPPKTSTSSSDIAEFFQGREIDGKKVYGASIYTERGSEGITMGVTNVLYDYGFKYEDPEQALCDGGLRQLARCGQGARVLQGALQVLHAARARPTPTCREGLDAFKSGQVAMQMNFFAFFPGLYKDPNVGGDKIGFFANPGRHRRASSPSSADRASRSSPTPTNQDEALRIHQVVRRSPTCRRSGGRSAAIPAPSRCSTTRASRTSAPFAADFLESMGMVKDFWAEPSYAQLLQAMQKRVHDYVVADKGTAQEALDGLVEDWNAVFKEDGKMF